jgi:hypothetical protein
MRILSCFEHLKGGILTESLFAVLLFYVSVISEQVQGGGVTSGCDVATLLGLQRT